MKKIILTYLLIGMTTVAAFSQFTFGGGLSYVNPGSSLGIQSKALLGISEKIDLSPSVGIFLEDGTPVVLDVDAQYSLLTIGDSFRLYPFAGLNYTFVDGADLGINIGASIRFAVNSNMVYIEPKYTILSYDGFAIAAGLLF